MSNIATWTWKWLARTWIFFPALPIPGRSGNLTAFDDDGADGANDSCFSSAEVTASTAGDGDVVVATAGDPETGAGEDWTGGGRDGPGPVDAGTGATARGGAAVGGAGEAAYEGGCDVWVGGDGAECAPRPRPRPRPRPPAAEEEAADCGGRLKSDCLEPRPDIVAGEGGLAVSFASFMENGLSSDSFKYWTALRGR